MAFGGWPKQATATAVIRRAWLVVSSDYDWTYSRPAATMYQYCIQASRGDAWPLGDCVAFGGLRKCTNIAEKC